MTALPQARSQARTQARTQVGGVVGGGADPFDPANISGMLSRFLDVTPGYHASTLGGLPILTPEEPGTLALPHGQHCLSFDGVNDQLTWTAANTGTQYVTYYNPATATWVSPVTLTHNGTAYVFAPGAVKVTNLKRWSIASPTSGQIEAITLTAAQGSGGLVSWHWCNEESGTTTYDVANATPLNATLVSGPTWTTDAGVTYNPANWLGHSKMLSFDGVDDHAFSVPLPLDLATDWTISFRVGGDIALTDLLCIGEATTTGFAIAYASNYVQLISTSAFPDNIVTVPSSAWRTLAVTKSGTTITVYVDGVASGSITRSPTASNEMLRLGQLRYSGTNYNRGVKSLTNIRIYTVCKSAGEVAAIHSGTNDTTSLLALYNDQYDESGNNYHLDLINGTGAVVVPRNEATPAQDALGNALTVVGPLKHPATTEVRCVTGDGSAVNIALSDLSLSITQLSMWVKLVSDNQVIATLQNSTATAISVVAGVMTFGGSLTVSAISVDGSTVSAATAGATLNDNAWHRVILTMTSISCSNVKLLTDSSVFGSVQISDIQFIGSITKYLPLQEGPGSSNTNRDRYWIGSDGTSGVVSNADVNGTVANINANYCPYARSHCIEYGGGVAANGAFIPGRIGSGLDALGNAKTIPAGEPSPYDLIYPNRWGAPELVNVGIASSTAWGKTTAVQATAPADTKFRNTTKGTKNLIYSDAKSGADKTNLETYVST